MVSQESPRKWANPPATDYRLSAVLQVFGAAWPFRLCARFHLSGSKPLDFCAQNAERRRASQVLSGARRARAYGAIALRHLVMPEVFRLLYGCGFRVREVLKLRVRDVDLNQGTITVRQGKGRKDRLVPPALALVNRLRKYAARLENRPPDATFFPGVSGRPFSLRTVYTLFRQLLLRCGIPHAGRGKGPRIHDYRHLFAVHALRRWYREGADLDAKLPLLATYLGHQHLSGTQHYLHLTAELFPEITARAEAAFGDVIPRRIEL
jgi:integrase/recombinase XerD